MAAQQAPREGWRETLITGASYACSSPLRIRARGVRGSTPDGSVAGNDLKREVTWPELPLGGDPEQAFNERRLPHRVSAVQPLHSPPPHHV